MCSPDINRRLIRGEIVPVGHRLYALCRDCHSLVRVNKPLLGGVHICVPEWPRSGSRDGAT